MLIFLQTASEVLQVAENWDRELGQACFLRLIMGRMIGSGMMGIKSESAGTSRGCSTSPKGQTCYRDGPCLRWGQHACGQNQPV